MDEKIDKDVEVAFVEVGYGLECLDAESYFFNDKQKLPKKGKLSEKGKL